MNNKDFQIIRVTSYLYLLVVINYDSHKIDVFRKEFSENFKNIKTTCTGSITTNYSYWTIEIRNTKHETISDEVFNFVNSYFN